MADESDLYWNSVDEEDEASSYWNSATVTPQPEAVVPESPGFLSRAGQYFIDIPKGVASFAGSTGSFLADALWRKGPIDATLERLPTDPTKYLDFAGRVGAETAGGAAGATFAPATFGLSVPVGAALGGYGYDFLNYLVGNEKDIPDPARLPAEMVFNTITGPVASKTADVVGAGATKLGNYIDDVYDPARAMRGAVNPNWADYKPGPGQIPLDEAISEAVDTGLVNPKKYAGMRQPFTAMADDLFGRMETLAPGNMSALDVAGKQVDQAVSRIPGEIPYENLNPRNILPKDDIAFTTAATKEGVATGQFTKDMELFARSTGMDDAAAKEWAKTAATKGTDPTTRMLLKNQVEPPPLTPQQAIERARAFSEPSAWDNMPGSPKADAFKALESATRGEVKDLAAKAGPDIAGEFSDANRKYQLMSTLKDSVENRALQEMQPVQAPTLRGYASVLNPMNMRAATVAGPRQIAKDPAKLLNIAAGNTFGQRSGLATRGASVLQGIGTAGEAIGANPGLGIGLAEAFDTTNEPMDGPGLLRSPLVKGLSAASMSPAFADDGRPEGVKTSLPMSFQPDERAGNVPRHIGAVDPRMVGSFLNQYVAPQDIQPLAIQAMKVFGSKDNKEIARFLGALTEKYPDMPFERGPVTGLPSEWQMEDGSTKLFSDIDVMKWAQEIENSPLREDEKAQRLRALRTDGTVYPLDRKLNDFGPPILSDSAMNSPVSPADVALRNLMSQSQFKPRRMTPLGSARME